jgi:AraC family transcriptional activator of pobA
MEAITAIPYYFEINDFLQSLPSDNRTKNPLFYCMRLKQNDGSVNNYKPPYRKDFYFIALMTNSCKTKITYDNINVTKINSFLVFQSPGQLYSFFRDKRTQGYLIYFKSQCFSFFKPDFDKEFPFFDILHTNFFKFNQTKFKYFMPLFEEVFSAYENSNDNYNVATIKLLALLYQLKEYSTAFNQWEQGFTTPQQILYLKFIQLINNFYIEKKTVEEYAEMLFVTPNYLSQSVKSVSGKNSLSFINERLINEAKSFIQYTNLDIAEIAYKLNFTDPANFGKFFKKSSRKRMSKQAHSQTSHTT